MSLVAKLFTAVLILFHFAHTTEAQSLQGAWKGEHSVLIMTNGFFSYSDFSQDDFNFTFGGSYSKASDGQLSLEYEFHTSDPDMVGKSVPMDFKSEGAKLWLGEKQYSKIDDGQPGELSGAWLFYNRVRDGKMGNPRYADNPRKTMKILSGTRFQWIAYNDSTGSFHGTGGGTYTTQNGKYVENIDFFSRDNSRIGASLEFDFEIKGDEWHHQGLSSKGDPIYEIWKFRE